MDAVRESSAYATLDGWLTRIGLAQMRSALAPLVVIFVSTPVIVVVSLLAVAVLMSPAILRLVSARRFPDLALRRGGSIAGSVWMATWSTVAALTALVLSMPLWLIPPLVLILPPLIWGWLTYRLFAYDVLADHASKDERRELMRRHRPSLFAMGVVTGYLGAAPSLVWVSGAMAVVLAPVLIPLAIWIYTLVFAFASLWFAHYGLAALQMLRVEQLVVDLPPAPPPATAPVLPAPPGPDVVH